MGLNAFLLLEQETMFWSLFNQNIIILLIILNLEFFVLRGLNLLLKFHLFFFFLNFLDF